MNNKRAAAYIRVSTASDAQLHSYGFQEQYWKEQLEKEPGVDYVGVYADRGISGRSVEHRPQFLRMMQDAREGKIDVIYCKSVSRFARNTTQLLEAVRELRDLGVEVVFEDGNIRTLQPTAEVFLTIAAAIAENDLEVDSKRMLWSIRHRYENGWISIGAGLYGYRMTKENTLEIVPEEAAVVRDIYAAYLNGDGGRTIAGRLNRAGIRTRDGNLWSSWRVLELIGNEKYKGDSMMGKGVYVGGKHIHNSDGKSGPTYYIEDSHEGIVSKETWQKAQELRKQRSSLRKAPSAYPFTGLITCKTCGGAFLHRIGSGGTKWAKAYWICAKQAQFGKTACPAQRIKDSVLKEKFVEAYNEFVRERPAGDAEQLLSAERKTLEEEAHRLASLHLRRLLSDASYEKEMQTVRERIKEIDKRVEDIRGRNVKASDHTPITAFDETKMKQFLRGIAVGGHTVTFTFYNDAQIQKTYDNGKPGNQKGWNRKESR